MPSTHEPSIFEPRQKGISLSGLSAAYVNSDTIYLFGGDQGNVWALNTSDINEEYSEQWIPAQSAIPLHWMYASSGLPLNAGFQNTTAFLVVGTARPEDLFLSIYQFDTVSHAWSPLPTQNTSMPFASKHHSSVLLKDRVLVYGGENSTHAMGHFWSYDMLAQRWTNLDLPPDVMRCGQSVSLLDDGRMLILGGFKCAKDQPLNEYPKELASMSIVIVYDTSSGVWSEQSTLGPCPQPRAYHTAVKSTANLIVIVGGQDGTPPPYQNYLSSNGHIQDMVAILNITTWQWTLIAGTSTMNQPLPQSMAAVGLMLDDHRLLYGFGISYQTIYSGLYIFDINTHKWIPPSWDQEQVEWVSSSTGLDGTDEHTDFNETRHILHIVLACVGTLCFLVVLILMYRMGRQWKQKIVACLTYFKSKIWKPRAGEPSWTESVRLTMMFVYICFFLFLIFCLADQVANSPIIDQVSYLNNPSATINAPDIRFCLDDEHTVIRCGTDLGVQCSDYLITMPKSMRRHRNQHCHLFRAHPSFKLGQTSDRLASNGSYLKFDYYFGQPTQLEVIFYNTHHNPNLAVYSVSDPYNTSTSPSFTWNDPLEESTFRLSERKGALLKNIYQLDVNVVSSGSYELLQRATLLDTFWNYVGFSPDVETFYEIDTKVQSETTPSDYSSIPRPLGSLHVYPRLYQIKTLHEQRAFAMVNATGVFGGLFGLLVSFQACLFGYRPKSPLGVVHRWSIGNMKRSLLIGLQKSFVPQTTNVPIVHPMRDPTMNSTMMRSMMEGSHSTLSGIRQSTALLNDAITSSKSTMSIASDSMSVSTPSLSPSPTMPPYTTTRTRKPIRAVTRQPSLPQPFFQEGFVDEPESYDDSSNWILGAERLTRMEDRLEVLEKVFQAYYIDDEIFSALGLASQVESLSTNTQHRRPTLRFRTPFRRRP
ncbi:hypothetical protein BC941DRAFT_115061 [Chlamydoabsidia padenii]|nr:hypothetical protein BC941DRAFT_115061 [Chlamydoabsidia padenii]